MKYYDLPMGAPITPGAKEAARLRNGGRSAPKGASKQSRVGPSFKAKSPLAPAPKSMQAPHVPGAPAPKAQVAVTPAKPAKPVARPIPKIEIQSTPSIGGTRKFEVGGKEHSAPAGSRVFNSTGGNSVSYVVTPDGDVHVFGKNGEVKLAPEDQAMVKAAMAASPNMISEVADTPRAPEVPKTPDVPVTTPVTTPVTAPTAPTEKAPKAPVVPKAAEPAKVAAPKAAEPAKAPDAPKNGSAADTQAKASKVARTPRNPKSLGENVAPPDAEAIAALSISPYSQAHILPNGEFTPERKKLHEDIINSFLVGLEAQDNPVQYMNGGGPASGKGSMTHGTNARLTNYPTARTVDDHTGNFKDFRGTPEALLIDPDAIKQQFPETKLALERIRAGDFGEEDTQWAAHSHEESSLLAKRLHMAAVERRHHIIFDGTGAHIKSVTKTATLAKDAGYKVEANYLYLEPQVGMQRALDRAAESHRVVPPERIKDIYENVPRTLNELHDSGLFDKINVFDNNVPRGETAPLIGSGGGTNFTVHDQRAWDSFMSSPDRIHQIAA